MSFRALLQFSNLVFHRFDSLSIFFIFADIYKGKSWKKVRLETQKKKKRWVMKQNTKTFPCVDVQTVTDGLLHSNQ